MPVNRQKCQLLETYNINIILVALLHCFNYKDEDVGYTLVSIDLNV
jgi:hypothetical protein